MSRNKFDNRPLADDDDRELSGDNKVTKLQARNVVVWPSDWTTDTILKQIDKGKIDLNPNFQRRSVWNDYKKSCFIESLMMNIPVPQIVLAEGKKRGDPFIVIDGKQRLTAIQHFASKEKSHNSSSLKLQRLKFLDKLNKKSFEDLKNDKKLKEYVSDFENSSIRTVVIGNWKTEDFLHETFLRINTGSVKLSPQELRQALHPGKFSEFVFSESEKSEELKLVLNIDGPDARMMDAELLLRYISYKNFIENYNGNLKDFLDKTTEFFNKNWDEKKEEIEDQVKQMEKAYKFTRDIFGANYMCKSDGSGAYEMRRNKAVIDIMLHYFSCPDIRAALKNRFKDVEKKFNELCGDEKFRSCFERSTKNKEVNKTRFNMWGDALEKMAKMDLKKLKFPDKTPRGK